MNPPSTLAAETFDSAMTGRPLADYAFHDRHSAGRLHADHLSDGDTPFAVDRTRLIQCAAFRRLSAKTQVFTGEPGDYHRTRLTHTLEVADLARALARALGLNEDLVEALALVHDLGHPPFGHSGEAVLNNCLAAEGGFCHNRHALWLATELEEFRPEFPGLNLSIEILDGQQARVEKRSARQRPLLEVQVVEAADTATYDAHDTDDALKLGILRPEELLSLSFWNQARQHVLDQSGRLEPAALQRAILHELVTWQRHDLVTHTRQQLEQLNVHSPQSVAHLPTIVCPSPELAKAKAEFERFLYERVYRHPRVMRIRGKVQARLELLFDYFCQHPRNMPPRFAARVDRCGLERTVVDYLAGMTDRFALDQYERLATETTSRAWVA